MSIFLLFQDEFQYSPNGRGPEGTTEVFMKSRVYLWKEISKMEVSNSKNRKPSPDSRKTSCLIESVNRACIWTISVTATADWKTQATDAMTAHIQWIFGILSMFVEAIATLQTSYVCNCWANEKNSRRVAQSGLSTPPRKTWLRRTLSSPPTKTDDWVATSKGDHNRLLVLRGNDVDCSAKIFTQNKFSARYH